MKIMEDIFEKLASKNVRKQRAALAGKIHNRWAAGEPGTFGARNSYVGHKSWAQSAGKEAAEDLAKAVGGKHAPGSPYSKKLKKLYASNAGRKISLGINDAGDARTALRRAGKESAMSRADAKAKKHLDSLRNFGGKASHSANASTSTKAKRILRKADRSLYRASKKAGKNIASAGEKASILGKKVRGVAKEGLKRGLKKALFRLG